MRQTAKFLQAYGLFVKIIKQVAELYWLFQLHIPWENVEKTVLLLLKILHYIAQWGI